MQKQYIYFLTIDRVVNSCEVFYFDSSRFVVIFFFLLKRLSLMTFLVTME